MIFKFRHGVIGGHVHVRVFADLDKLGDLIMRSDEFTEFKAMCLESGGEWVGSVEFIDEDEITSKTWAKAIHPSRTGRIPTREEWNRNMPPSERVMPNPADELLK